jgi:hypothetical protein
MQIEQRMLFGQPLGGAHDDIRYRPRFDQHCNPGGRLNVSATKLGGSVNIHQSRLRGMFDSSYVLIIAKTTRSGKNKLSLWFPRTCESRGITVNS